VKEVLAFTKYYVPYYSGGGPVISLKNMVFHLRDEFLFKIITAEHNSEEDRKVDSSSIDTWRDVGSAKVFYCPEKNRSLVSQYEVAKNASFDIIYINNFFNLRFCIFPQILWRLSLFGNVPLILASRGVFASGAISLKWHKKRAYVSLYRLLNQHKKVIWHASTKNEAKNIKNLMGNKVGVCVAPNLPSKDLKAHKNKEKKEHIKILFLSRIAPKKNLKYALQVLSKVGQKVTFIIYGYVEDKKYWSECKNLIDKMPNNVSVKYNGPVPHHEVADVMEEHDLFFFPTRGENFGHVIYEALACGCPVLISDQTPWEGLRQRKAGNTFSLSSPENFVGFIEEYASLSPDERSRWSDCASEVASEYIQESARVEKNRELFRNALRS
jgi:glycosyltransferase involved in cell wall biosynthesis